MQPRALPTTAGAGLTQTLAGLRLQAQVCPAIQSLLVVFQGWVVIFTNRVGLK